jgi:hypothetical protein
VDVVAWSFFRKYEYEDPSYSDLANDIVVEEALV